MKSFLIGLGSLLCSGLAAVAVAAQPFFEIRAGDGSVRIERGFDGLDITSNGDIQTWRVASVSLNNGTDVFSNLVFTFDPDPFIDFGVSLTKSSASVTTYSFLFGIPTVGGPYDTVSSAITVAAIDAAGQGTLKATNMRQTTLVDAAERLAVDLLDCTSIVASTNCTLADGLSPLPAPTGSTPFLTGTFTFTLDTQGTAQFTGRNDLFLAAQQPVPLPGSAPLVLLALGVLGLALRRPAAGGRQR